MPLLLIGVHPKLDLFNFDAPEHQQSRYILTSPRSLKVGRAPHDLVVASESLRNVVYIISGLCETTSQWSLTAQTYHTHDGCEGNLVLSPPPYLLLLVIHVI